MQRIPSSPPVIPPVPPGEKRPLWSIMIPAFNCINYLRQSLQSVMCQYEEDGNMQVEVIDDSSTDGDIAALVREIGNGKIGYYRQPENKGSLRNFETCLNRARGQYVHILHGDDFVEPGFYATIQSLFEANPSAGAACTNFTEVDEHGILLADSRLRIPGDGIDENWLEKIAKQQLLQPPAVVVKRDVYEKLGGFYGVEYGEDWDMWIRIAANYPVAFSPRILAHYRVHTANISSTALISGQHLRDIKKVIQQSYAVLPPAKRDEWSQAARLNWGNYFARTSDKTYGKYGKRAQAFRQSVAAFRLSANRVTLYYMVKTLIKLILGLKPRQP